MNEEKARGKQDEEKKIFNFTSLRVWREIFPAVMDLEKALKSNPSTGENPVRDRLLTTAHQALEELVAGYYKFHLAEKYLEYNRARRKASIALFLTYRMGFSGTLEKEQALHLGKRLKESIIMMNSLIKNLENKIKRMGEARELLEKIRM